MQSVLREKLLAQGVKLAEVSAVYRTDSHRFADAFLRWLEEAAQDLGPLRSPVSILLQAEKTSLVSVVDGYVPGHIQAGKNVRKTLRAAAAQSLERISRELYAQIGQIDSALEQSNEKLCHAVAVLASKDPAVFRDLQASQQGISALWQLLARTPETVPMYNCFSARLAPTDRDYILLDIAQKIVGNRIGGG